MSVEKVADYEFAAPERGVHYDWFADRVIDYLQSRSPETPPRFFVDDFLDDGVCPVVCEDSPVCERAEYGASDFVLALSWGVHLVEEDYCPVFGAQFF